MYSIYLVGIYSSSYKRGLKEFCVAVLAKRDQAESRLVKLSQVKVSQGEKCVY